MKLYKSFIVIFILESAAASVPWIADKISIFAVLKRRILQRRETERSVDL